MYEKYGQSSTGIFITGGPHAREGHTLQCRYKKEQECAIQTLSWWLRKTGKWGHETATQKIKNIRPLTVFPRGINISISFSLQNCVRKEFFKKA